MITSSGTPYIEWQAKNGGARWMTDEECRLEYGVSRDRWLELWRTMHVGDWWRMVKAMKEKTSTAI